MFDAKQMEITMTKKYRYLYAIVVLGLLCIGCAEKDEHAEVKEAEAAAQTANSDNQKTLAASIEPGIGVGKVKLGMTLDELKKALGKPDIDATGFSYVYADLGMEVVLKNDKVVNILCVQHIPNAPEVKACEYQTAEGIGIGSTESDIIAAYNEPTERNSGYLIYSDLGLRFKIVNGQTQKIVALKPL
jgi:hypothetical protein